mmetsp:Transcript_31132/g.88936  ORF Transcript_31132/g.88936 Transcript_31132/m.88936 type:complete len:212 (-) Transcript_31132:408-1043(-)
MHGVHRHEHWLDTLQQVLDGRGSISVLDDPHRHPHGLFEHPLPSVILRQPELLPGHGRHSWQAAHSRQMVRADRHRICRELVCLESGVSLLQRDLLAVLEGGERRHHLLDVRRGWSAGHDSAPSGDHRLGHHRLVLRRVRRGAVCVDRLRLPGRVAVRGVLPGSDGRARAHRGELEVGPSQLHAVHLADMPDGPPRGQRLRVGSGDSAGAC